MKQLALILCIWLYPAIAMDGDARHEEDILGLIKKYTNLADSPPLSPHLKQLETQNNLLAAAQKESLLVRLQLVKKEEESLGEHQVTLEYSPIKSFKCIECSREFKTKKEHTNHFLRKHQTAKPFECEDCDSTYSTKSSCNLHHKRKHGPLIYECNFCSDVAFAVKGDFNQHMRRKHRIGIKKEAQ